MDSATRNFGQKDFPWLENELAKKLGVRPERLRELRAGLVRGVDWRRAGKVIQWSGLAVEVLIKKLALGPAAPAQAPAEREMRVRRFRFVNPHIIECEDALGICCVRVASNVNFRPGMLVRAIKSEAGWALMGRCPRFPGRF